MFRAIFYGMGAVSFAFGMAVTAMGQGRPSSPVEVVNTTPIPVTGVVTVASAPNAPVTVTTAPNAPVSVTGDVNVAGTVGVSGPVNVAGPVGVTNAPNTTLKVSDVNSAKKIPIQLKGTCHDVFGCGSVINYSVPNGKMLVIEFVSTRVFASVGIKGRVAIITCTGESACIDPPSFPGDPGSDRRNGYFLNPTEGSAGWTGSVNFAAASQNVLIYANDRDPVTVWAECSALNGSDCSFTIAMSGYLIDEPTP